jgi:hypothetical protein
MKMKELHVKILRRVRSDQLLHSYDPETENHLVFLRTSGNSKIAYSINFNSGELILGLNANRRINSLELNLSKKNWTPVEGKFLRPNTTVEGSVEFTNINSRHTELILPPLIVQTDRLFSAVKIDMGINKTSNPIWVHISHQCFLKITDNCLSGFWIDIYRLGSTIG